MCVHRFLIIIRYQLISSPPLQASLLNLVTHLLVSSKFRQFQVFPPQPWTADYCSNLNTKQPLGIQWPMILFTVMCLVMALKEAHYGVMPCLYWILQHMEIQLGTLWSRDFQRKPMKLLGTITSLMPVSKFQLIEILNKCLNIYWGCYWSKP